MVCMINVTEKSFVGYLLADKGTPSTTCVGWAGCMKCFRVALASVCPSTFVIFVI